MKKVAIIGSGWKNCFVSAWVIGAQNYIKEHNLQVRLCFFHCFGSFSMDEKFNLGEYNIFNLPDFDDFDGIIYDATNIEDFSIREMIVNRLRATKTPVVSLVEHYEDFYFCGIDNYKAEYQMVEHLIQYHGARKINFVGGRSESEENSLRKKAFCDCLRNYGIPVEEWRFFEKDFDIQTGIDAFKTFKQRDMIPDAVVCSNDNQAVGLCYTAQHEGYKIPDDFMVTGFDDFDKAAYFDPPISTVGFVREDMTSEAMHILHQLWEGKQPPKESYISTYPVFQDSCGCTNLNPPSRTEYLKDLIVSQTKDTELTNLLLSLRRDLQNCTSFSELGDAIPKCAKELNMESAYIIMNKDILTASHFSGRDEFSGYQFQIYGYPEEMAVAVAYNRDHPDFYDFKEGDRLFPGDAQEEESCFYLIAPLHFREHEAGYFVVKNCLRACESQAIFRVINTMLETIENLYHQLVLRHMNQELSRLYVMDSLTGLYNRTAYSRMALPMFNRARREGKVLAVLFFDLDRLKYINDNYGHDHGDIAIRAVATAIEGVMPVDAVSIRYGGDEFISLVPDLDQEGALDLLAQTQERITKLRDKYQTSYDISVSVGYVMTDPASDKKLDDYINEADDRMYEIKQKHHEEMDKKLQ